MRAKLNKLSSRQSLYSAVAAVRTMLHETAWHVWIAVEENQQRGNPCKKASAVEQLTPSFLHADAAGTLPPASPALSWLPAGHAAAAA